MTAEVTERTAQIRGVNVRWADVIVAGHTVEQVLSFDVAEAEAEYGRPFDDELDRHIQMGMFAMDRISADGTMHKVASATSYVLDGKCIRTAKIAHCKDMEPMSADWSITRADGSQVHRQPWSCVPGTLPTAHSDLPADDDVTHFLRGVGERVISILQDDDLKPDMKSGWAGSLAHGYRFYNLWYSRPPWGEWDMSYRVNLRRSNDDEPSATKWHAVVGFTYMKGKNRGLQFWLAAGPIAVDGQIKRTDQVEDVNGRLVEEYDIVEVSQYSDALDESLASALANTLRSFVEVITPVVDMFELELRCSQRLPGGEVAGTAGETVAGPQRDDRPADGA